MSRELLKRAAVILHDHFDGVNWAKPLLNDIDNELAQPKREPVAFVSGGTVNWIQPQAGVLKDKQPLYASPPDQSTRIAELEKDNDITHGNLAWYMAKYYEHIKIIEVLRDLLIRYRNETPIGHQPHMIAHEVDNALAAHGIGINHE